MSRRMSYSDARQRAQDVLDAPRTVPISPDYFPGSRQELLNILVRTGRSGSFGEYFEDLNGPHALHIPGVQTRTDKAVTDAISELGITVIPDSVHGMTPAFGIGGDYSASELVTIQGVCLALASAYMERGDVPIEFQYAASRIATSGTHANGAAHRLTNQLRKIQRDSLKEKR